MKAEIRFRKRPSRLRPTPPPSTRLGQPDVGMALPEEPVGVAKVRSLGYHGRYLVSPRNGEIDPHETPVVSSGERHSPCIRQSATHELSLCTRVAGKAPPASLGSFRLAVGGAFLF